MDRLSHDVVRIIVEHALDGEEGVTSRQHRRICVLGVVNKAFHAVASKLDKYLTVYHPGSKHSCPALSYESLTTDLRLVWSHTDPTIALDLREPSYRGREGYDIDLLSDVSRLTIKIDNLVERAERVPLSAPGIDGHVSILPFIAARGRFTVHVEACEGMTQGIVDYLCGKAVLLPRLKYLRLSGEVHIERIFVEQLLHCCDELETFVTEHSCTLHPPPRAPEDTEPVVHPALPCRLRHVELNAGSHSLLTWLLTPTAVDADGNEITARSVGMADRFSLRLPSLDTRLKDDEHRLTDLVICSLPLSPEAEDQRRGRTPLRYLPRFAPFFFCTSLVITNLTDWEWITELQQFVALRYLAIGAIAFDSPQLVLRGIMTMGALEFVQVPKEMPTTTMQNRSEVYFAMIELERHCRDKSVRLAWH